MKKMILPALLVLGLCLSVESIAQDTKTIYFNTTPSKSRSRSRGSQADGQNSLSLQLLSFLDGYTAVQYERPVNDWISLSGGLGFTFYSRMQHIGESVHNRWDYYHDVPFDHDIEDDYADMTFRTVRPGIYASFSPRFYPRAGVMQGGFIAPMIEYRVYNFDVQAPVAGTFMSSGYPSSDASDVIRDGGKLPERFRTIDFTACFGSHAQLRNHMTIGYFMGIGARQFKASRVDLGVNEVSSSTYRYVYLKDVYSGTRVLVNLGFFMGGWW